MQVQAFLIALLGFSAAANAFNVHRLISRGRVDRRTPPAIASGINSATQPAATRPAAAQPAAAQPVAAQPVAAQPVAAQPVAPPNIIITTPGSIVPAGGGQPLLATAQLNPNLIQTASQSDGNVPPKDNQTASATDPNNFINFCDGSELTNGAQDHPGASCNGIPMGKIPSKDNMISTLFTSPQNGQEILENSPIKFQLKVTGLATGQFTNPNNTYYAAPQDLDEQGRIKGHTHITVQNMGDPNSQTPPNPIDFAHFVGVNNNGDGNGLLSADKPDGLPAGNYRVCSLTASANHQPVVMPVAKRGAQDDCVRFTVKANVK